MITSGISYNETITMVTEICCKCGIAFGVPSDLRRQYLNNPEQSFYCPNGHGQHYQYSKEEKLRKEAERKLQQKENELANLAASKIQLEAELKKAQSKLHRMHNGTCPCCKRSFQNLVNHIKAKHPELLKPTK